eukprot:2864506-Amphidinium_carterae.1
MNCWTPCGSTHKSPFGAVLTIFTSTFTVVDLSPADSANELNAMTSSTSGSGTHTSHSGFQGAHTAPWLHLH